MLENPLDILHEVMSYIHTKKHEFYEVLCMQREMLLRANDPQWDTEVPADISIQPYVVNYRNRKHIFIYNPQTYVVNLSDNAGEFTTQLLPNTWNHIDFPNGTRLQAVSGSSGTIVAAGVVIKVQCTDELILPTVINTPSAGYSTLSSVASSASSGVLSKANIWRKSWSVFNESTAILYIAFAPTASLTAYTVQVAPQGFYELPFPIYGGVISGIWASANGNARVTELT